VLFSEPKIPQSAPDAAAPRAAPQFQCSSASRKFLNGARIVAAVGHKPFQCSSASRKFLNGVWLLITSLLYRFQCSSASRKFLNACPICGALEVVAGFSALQRAENSSIHAVSRSRTRVKRFQCSSASRKFLN